MKARAITLLLIVACASACGKQSEASAAQKRALLNQRDSQVTARLAVADANPDQQKPVAMWMMPPELREISGLAIDGAGRLLAHDDEIGRVYALDARRGVILKRFTLSGSPRADFEGITVAGNNIFLLQSNGRLYEFKEGADGATVPYTVHDTRLGNECEFEGVAYQADSAWLVLPCKTIGKKKREDDLVIYRWRLRNTAGRESKLTIPVASVVGSNPWTTLHPSDISIDPNSGNYVLVASQEKALIEITPDGRPVRAAPLPPGHHQPEGVAVTKDGILIVSDEATKRPAAITLYRWRP